MSFSKSLQTEVLRLRAEHLSKADRRAREAAAANARLDAIHAASLELDARIARLLDR